MASTSREADNSVVFRILTTNSLKELLTDAKERTVPKPDKSLNEGNRLPEKLLKIFDHKTMACVPIEEIDPSYKNHKTFVVVGKNGTIHRYSATNSLSTLSPLNPVRKVAIYLTTHFAFAAFMVAVVIFNTTCLIMKKKRAFDYACTIIYAVEMVLKIFSRGFLIHPFSYLRSPSNWLDFAVISTSLVGPIQAIKPLQWIRVLKIIPLVSEIKRSFSLITKSVVKLKVAILLATISSFIFTLLGMQLYKGILTNRCIERPNELSSEELQEIHAESNSTNSSDIEFTIEKYYSTSEFWFSDDICAQGSNDQCSNDYDCIFGYGSNPNYGYTNFDSFWLGWMNTVRIIDQDYLDGILNQITRATGPTSLFFFIPIFFFGTYAIGTLAYSLVSEYLFWVMENTGKFEDPPPTTEEDNPDQEDANVGVTYIYTRHARDEYRIKAKAMIEHMSFEVIITATIIIDILVLVIRNGHDMSTSMEQIFKLIRLAVWVVYSAEFILKFYVQGIKGYFKNCWNIFDFIALLDISLYEFVEDYFMPIPFRMFKITPRWTTLNLVFRILFASLKSLWGVVGLALTLWAFFALFGAALFGEAYLENSSLFDNGEIPRWNFLDLPHAAMIVFRSWIGESIESVWGCLVVYDSGCLLYFPIVALSGSLIIMILTIGVAFITEDILRIMESVPVNKTSILETIFCVPFLWIKAKCKKRRRMSLVKPNKRQVTSCDIVTHGLKLKRVATGRTIATKPMGGSRVLKGISIFIILIASLVLILDNTPYQNNIDIHSFVYAVDIVFTVFFTIMAVYNLVVVGVKECLTSPGWIFDLFVILEMVLNVIYVIRSLSLPNGYPYPMFFLFRSLRPFMLVSRIDRLEVVLRGLLEELGFLRNYIFAGFFIRLFFAVMGTELFGGGFSKCLDENDGSVLNSTIISNQDECLESNYTWINSDYNFDDVGKSFASLTLISSRSSWISILHDTFDFRSTTMNFEPEFDLSNFIYFLAFFIFGIFSFISILFGVLYFNLKEFSGIFLTKEQTKSYQEEMKSAKPKEIQKFKPIRPIGQKRGRIFDFVNDRKFDIAVMSLIFIDNILLAFNSFTQFGSSAEENVDSNLEYVAEMLRLKIVLLYTTELLLKIIAWGKQYFISGWNRYDFLVTIVCLIDCILVYILDPPFLRLSNIAAVLRILRLLRLFQFRPFVVRAKVLRGYFYAYSLAKPALWNILIFQGMTMYSYSLFGMSKFGDVKLVKGLDYLFNFHTFSSSFRVLFMLSSFCGIGGVLSPLTEEEQCIPGDPDGHGDCGDSYWGTLFVFSYLFISFLNFMNIYILFILEIVDQLEKNRSEETTGRISISLAPQDMNEDETDADQLEIVKTENGLQNN